MDKVRDRLVVRLPSAFRVLSIDDRGIEFVQRGPDRVWDVQFDGRRIWSFWGVRDTVSTGLATRRRAEWPQRMVPYLDGASRLSVVDHVRDETVFDEEIVFGEGAGRVEFVNNKGLEISLDKSGRFSATFDVRSGENLEPLLDSMDTVIAALKDVGVIAFPAWGTLLGAVREGRLLGHDSDADLTYLSRATTPVDVTRESFELQRLLVQRGFQTYRYSGAAFRIDVVESDGAVRGLDLFAAFYDSGRLYVMGEVGTDYEQDWLLPYSTCRIGERTYAAPARPDKMLEAMYGPGWKVPDPAFKFATPADTHARLNGWFRGMATFRQEWERQYSPPGRPAPGASRVAQLLHAEVAEGTAVLDIGTGSGRDALWLARQGRDVTGYDYVPRAFRPAARIAAKQDLADLDFRELNLTDLRSVLGEGARVVRTAGPRVLLARHLLDATTVAGRQNFARFASLALRDGGRLYADVWVEGASAPFGLRRTTTDQVVRTVEAGGGTVLSVERCAADEDFGGVDAVVGRVIAEWT